MKDLGIVVNLTVRREYHLPEGLDPKLEAELKAGKAYKFTFCYRGGYEAETAYLVGNATGFFALVGTPASSEWCELQTVASDALADADDDDDELDFEMF